MTIAEFEKIGKKEGFILYSYHDTIIIVIEIGINGPRGLQLVDDTREPRARHLLSKKRFEFRFESRKDRCASI